MVHRCYCNRDVHITPGVRWEPAAVPLRNGAVRWMGFTIMILPQVHLRKPCYDFYFL